jgi:hypothetical protein
LLKFGGILLEFPQIKTQYNRPRPACSSFALVTRISQSMLPGGEETRHFKFENKKEQNIEYSLFSR